MNTPLKLTLKQARQFILRRHGLIGEYAFRGKQGALEFIRRTGCVQFDPVDVCGRNADIVLNSRVKDYRKATLDELLYKDRLLIDYFDKNLSIFPVENLPAFLGQRMDGGYAEAYDRRGGEAVKKIEPLIRELISERGHISAKEIDAGESIEWHWSQMTSLPRAALESMYFRGELIIHHKNGTNKSYAFMKDHVPPETLNAAPPFANEDERLSWNIKRRIGAVGMLRNKASDAWLGLSLKAAEREGAFERLLGGGAIIEVAVDGLNDTLFCIAEDAPLIEDVILDKELKPRCEFIAPLDSFMWDRKLIKALFEFDYTWEIYTPAVKRKYGGYVLPVLYGDRLVARVEPVCDRKAGTLTVRNIWFEDGIKPTKTLQRALDGCLNRFAKFNGCEAMSIDVEALN